MHDLNPRTNPPSFALLPRQAVNKLAAERRIEKSQVQYISTSGSTYTVLWNTHAWDDHISVYRYVRHIMNWPQSTTAAMVAPVLSGPRVCARVSL